MAGSRQPIVHSGPNPASHERGIALPLMSGDQQQNPVAGIDRAFQGSIDRLPGAIEAVPVKIERPVRLDPAAAQTPVPAAVERRFPV
jgi:hypothetical protein